MASRYWLKLFHEIIYDPKVMRLAPPARLRFYECLCLAGDINKGGELSPVPDMMFVFRVSEEQLIAELNELINAGLVMKQGEVYIVKNFKKRQEKMTDAERMNRYRDTKQKEEYYEDRVKRTSNELVTIRNADIDIDIDKDKEQDTEERLINQYLKVTGQDYFPKGRPNRTEWLMILEYLEKGGITEEIMIKACEGQKVTHPSQIVKECTRYIREKERDEHKRKVG